MNPQASVIVLTHNKLAVTQRCLPTLLETRYAPWELIVIDNGSTDGTAEWLDGFGRTLSASGIGFTLIRNRVNVGCSTARNQGIAESRGEWLAFIDNDVALRSRSWLCRFATVLAADSQVAAVGPKLVYPLPPHAIQCAGAAVTASGRIQFTGRGEDRDDPRFGRARDVQCLISACFMVRAAALRRCGTFDPAFNPVEYEDLDLCYRLRSHGWRLRYEPSVEMYHFESITTAGTATLPNTYLIVKHGMLFKQRWKHMFESEKGPDDSEAHWRRLPVPPFDAVANLPAVD